MKVYSPETIEETTKILGKLKGNVHLLAGGTDLVVKVKEGTVLPENLINIRKLPLDYIKEEGNQLRIGALTSIETIHRSKPIRTYAPILSDAAGKMGSPQIRNLATIGGNIANASPAADTVPPLFVLNAQIVLKDQKGSRVIPIEKFFSGPGENVMRRDEILMEITFRKCAQSDEWFFSKLGQRKALAISKVSLAFRGKVNQNRLTDVSIALGAVAPTVIYAQRTARFLESKTFDSALIDEASRIIQEEASPISDIRSTSEYRRRMVGALLKQGLWELKAGVSPD